MIDVRAAGVIVVAAAGNESVSDDLYPAGYDGVISVSAVGADGLPAPYTNYGASIDLAAPGGDFYTDVQPDGYVDGILSTLGTGANENPALTYGYYQGTSMAVALCGRRGRLDEGGPPWFDAG